MGQTSGIHIHAQLRECNNRERAPTSSGWIAVLVLSPSRSFACSAAVHAQAPGQEPNDAWMLYIGAGFTLISLLVPLWQWWQRRRRAAAKKREAEAEMARAVEKSRRTLEERMARMAAQSKEKEERDEAAEEEDETAPTSAASSLTTEEQRARDERRAQRAHHKKCRMLLRSMLRPLADAEAKIGKDQTLTPTDVDLLAAGLDLPQLESLIDQLWPLIGSDAESSQTRSGLSRSSGEANRILATLLAPLRAKAAAEAAAAAEREAQRLKAAASDAACKPASSSSSASSSKLPWTTAELSALARGTAKYVPGVQK